MDFNFLLEIIQFELQHNKNNIKISRAINLFIYVTLKFLILIWMPMHIVMRGELMVAILSWILTLWLIIIILLKRHLKLWWINLITNSFTSSFKRISLLLGLWSRIFFLGKRSVIIDKDTRKAKSRKQHLIKPQNQSSF